MNHHHHRLPHGHLPHGHPPHARLPHARLRARPSPARLSPTRPSPIPPPSAGPPSMHPPSARPPATAPPLGNPRPCTTGPSSTSHPRAPPSLPRPRPATTTAGPRRPTSKRQNTTTMAASPRFGGARTASAPASSSSSWWRSWERSLSDVPSFLFFSFFYIFALSRPESAIKGACIRIYISAFVPPIPPVLYRLFFLVYSFISCNLATYHGDMHTARLPSTVRAGDSSLHSPLCPPPMPVPEAIKSALRKAYPMSRWILHWVDIYAAAFAWVRSGQAAYTLSRGAEVCIPRGSRSCLEGPAPQFTMRFTRRMAFRSAPTLLKLKLQCHSLVAVPSSDSAIPFSIQSAGQTASQCST